MRAVGIGGVFVVVKHRIAVRVVSTRCWGGDGGYPAAAGRKTSPRSYSVNKFFYLLIGDFFKYKYRYGIR